MFKLLICNTLLFLFIHNDVNAGSAKEIRRRGRIFRNTLTTTSTKYEDRISLVPSSCVKVEATLPLCRNVRYLKFPKLPAVTFKNPTNNKVVDGDKTELKIETTPLGWGEYLGLYAPTVTVTTTSYRVSVVQDPSVVVTFALKGCRPLKLPMDLDRCPVEYTAPVPIEEVLRTSTVASPVVSTETLLPTKTMSSVGPTNLAENQTFPENSNLLEPSLHEIMENGPAQPTGTLTGS